TFRQSVARPPRLGVSVHQVCWASFLLPAQCYSCNYAIHTEYAAVHLVVPGEPPRVFRQLKGKSDYFQAHFGQRPCERLQFQLDLICRLTTLFKWVPELWY